MNAKIEFNFLTSLRGIAAIWVVFYHLIERLKPYLNDTFEYAVAGGYLAVDLFFVLSGFVIALSYQKSFQGGISWKGYRRFILKRLARIYPLHIMVLFLYIVIPIAYFLTGREHHDVTRFGVGNFISNAFLVNNWGFLEKLSWNIPAWSISVELFAYLAFPFIIFLQRKLKNVWIITIMSAVILSLFALFLNRMGSPNIGYDIPRFGLLRCIVSFIAGIAVFNIFKKFIHEGERKLMRVPLLLLTSCFALFFLGFYLQLPNYFYAPFCFSLFVLGTALFEYNSNLQPPKSLLFLGEISYSIYLLHYLLRDVFKLFLPSGDAPLWWIVLYFVVLILGSTISYQIIEKKGKSVAMSFLKRRSLV